MRKVSLLIVIMLAGAPLPSDVVVASRARPAEVQQRATHGLLRLTPHSGPSRMAFLDGVGCTEAICSRVAIPMLGDGDEADTLVDFDTITAIRPHDTGRATMDLIDGTSRQVVIPIENRVLYLSDASGEAQKLDLGAFAVIEFLR